MRIKDWGSENRPLFVAETRTDRLKRALFRERVLYQIVGVCVLYVLSRMVLS